MPSESVRDFLQPRESERPYARWPMLPVSIAAHAAAALAILIIPLAAEVELPEPAPLSRSLHVIPVKMPPPPPPGPPRPAAPITNRSAAPLEAPPTIALEEPVDTTPHVKGPPVDGGGLRFGEVGGVSVVPVPPPPPPPPRPTGPVRVGHGIREPKKIVHVAPVYPPIARSAGVQGTVMLEAIINERGVVENIRVLRSVTLLDNAAIEAVRAWRYTPTLLNGVPISVLLTITINFRLDR